MTSQNKANVFNRSPVPDRSNAPCIGCKDRQAGCHAKCVMYTAWQLAHMEMVKHNKQCRAKEQEEHVLRAQRVHNMKTRKCTEQNWKKRKR